MANADKKIFRRETSNVFNLKKNHDKNETFLGRLSNTVLSGFFFLPFFLFAKQIRKHFQFQHICHLVTTISIFLYGMKKSFGHFSKQKHLEPSAKFARAGMKIKFSFNCSKLLKVFLKRQKYFQTFHLASQQHQKSRGEKQSRENMHPIIFPRTNLYSDRFHNFWTEFKMRCRSPFRSIYQFEFSVVVKVLKGVIDSS